MTTLEPSSSAAAGLDLALPSEQAGKPTISRKAIAAAVAGNALEFYDFIIYAFFAVYIGRAFFPLGNDTASLLASVAVFGVGFVTRPLGGLLIGTFADKKGRKPAMILTISLITVGTLGMAATPSYATIGIAAPIIVLLCRLVQGIALGGEVGPATALLVEAAPDDRRGLYASWQIASQGLATLTGGLVGVLVALSLTSEQLAAWGWRLPFLVSLALIPVAIYIRRALPETLEEAPEKSGVEIVGTVVRTYRRYVVLGILVIMSIAVSTQVGNYMTTYAIHTLKLPDTLAQVTTMIGGLMTFAFALVGGMLSDRFGRRPVIVWPRAALILLIVPLFWWLDSSPSAVTLMIVTATITILTAMNAGATLTAIPELMPAAFRSTGTSLIYAFGVTIFGGTTQFIITWLIASVGPAAPAYYVAVTTAISLVAMAMLPETRHVDVRK